jgi:hypothetical protein
MIAGDQPGKQQGTQEKTAGEAILTFHLAHPQSLFAHTDYAARLFGWEAFSFRTPSN